MKIKVYSILLLSMLCGTRLSAQDVQIVTYEKLDTAIVEKKDSLTIVNFWATWCGPCVEEIPHFVEVFNDLKNGGNPVAIIFVSLDRKADMESVESFAKEHKLPGSLLLLSDVKRSNIWIPHIHADWQGNIPATGFYKDGRQLEFHPTMLSKKELTQIINKYK